VEIPNYYHFVATFEDGTEIIQNEYDKSEIDETKSQFFDVQEKAKESPLISIVLLGDRTLGVDLRDGHFEIDGFVFWQHRVDREDYKDFRPIYLRNVKLHMNITHDPQTGEILDQVMNGYELGYTLGWQTTHKGKNIQKIIKI
jgi:hypothetical protein